MWITFSLFLQYCYILASVQCEDHSHNDKSLPAIPNMPGSIRPQWFRLQPPDNSGSGHATISSDTWILVCFTIYSHRNKYTIQTTNFSVFCIFQYFSSLSTKTMGVTTAKTMAAASRNGPLAPHMRPCALRQRIEWMGGNPPSLRMYLGGIEGVYGSKSTPLFRRWCIATTSECFEGHTHPQQPQKLYPLAGGGQLTIHSTHWIGAQGLMWGTRGPFPLAAAMVRYGCVGQCRPLEADVRSTYCRNSMVTIVYGRIFFIPTYGDPIHSWHLTSEACHWGQVGPNCGTHCEPTVCWGRWCRGTGVQWSEAGERGRGRIP